MKRIKLFNRKLTKYTIVDDEDYELFRKYSWVLRTHCNINYASSSVKPYRNKSGNLKYRRLHLHRLIMKCPKNMIIDHINGNGLDNRRKNLRICTHADNMQNKKLYKNSTTGLRGVRYYSRYNKYVSYIQKDKVNHFLGYFSDKKEAFKCYLKKYKELNKDIKKRRFIISKNKIKTLPSRDSFTG